MIILNPKKSNTNFKEILKNYNSMSNLPYMECPICNSTQLIKWSSYERNINYIDNNVIMYSVIKIQRVKCKNCGHTHALLPSCIVPYRTSLLDVILYAITNDDITLTFSFDTINKWQKDFNKFIPYLKTFFQNISKLLIIMKLKLDIFKFYEIFYNSTKKILMMIHTGVVGMAYF